MSSEESFDPTRDRESLATWAFYAVISRDPSLDFVSKLTKSRKKVKIRIVIEDDEGMEHSFPFEESLRRLDESMLEKTKDIGKLLLEEIHDKVLDSFQTGFQVGFQESLGTLRSEFGVDDQELERLTYELASKKDNGDNYGI